MAWSNPFLRNKRCATVNLDEILNCKSCTAPSATRSDNCAPPACLHAHQKAMRAFSFGYRRLISAFHVFFLSKS
jgi:hypothetical protein